MSIINPVISPTGMANKPAGLYTIFKSPDLSGIWNRITIITIFLLVVVYHSVTFFKMFNYYTSNLMTPEIQ